jgi:hypothetical protein
MGLKCEIEEIGHGSCLPGVSSLGDQSVQLLIECFGVSMAETNCAKWRIESVPVGLREKGFEGRCYFCFLVLIYNFAAGTPSSGNFGLWVLS